MEARTADPGWKTMARSLRRTVRRARNRVRAASVVLLYHRVADGIPDPWSLCVSPANFRDQMAILAARGVRTLDAVVDDVDAGRRCRMPAVTFDDGYADFRDAALPALRAHGVPVSLFVTTGPLARLSELWWDELEHVVLGGRALPDTLWLDVGGAPFSWAEETDGGPRALYHALHPRLGRMPDAVRTRALEELCRWAGVERPRRLTHRTLDADDVAAIARLDGVVIGAHTVSHSYLGALPAEEQRREIDDSKRTLEAITGRPVLHFSYPHGDHAPETVAHVRDAGFRLACGSACAPIAGDVDRFDVPRVEVPNLAGPAFARWLDEWVG